MYTNFEKILHSLFDKLVAWLFNLDKYLLEQRKKNICINSSSKNSYFLLIKINYHYLFIKTNKKFIRQFTFEFIRKTLYAREISQR